MDVRKLSADSSPEELDEFKAAFFNSLISTAEGLVTSGSVVEVSFDAVRSRFVAKLVVSGVVRVCEASPSIAVAICNLGIRLYRNGSVSTEADLN